MRPIIGIPQCLDDRGRWRTGRDYLYIDSAYAAAVDEAGGTAIHLPLQSDPESLVDHIDGLLLPGGDDFLPDSPYPEDVSFAPVSEPQVAFDRRLLEAAITRGIPVLGICYGMQLMGLRAGARLYYHLPLDLPEASNHELAEERDPAIDAGGHGIEIEPGTRLAEALSAETARVNSSHHQALAEPGRELQVSARAEDGVIEAIESNGTPLYLGVQWHPEKLEGEGRSRIFRALVEAAERPAGSTS